MAEELAVRFGNDRTHVKDPGKYLVGARRSQMESKIGGG
jgi:hypothetical protein